VCAVFVCFTYLLSLPVYLVLPSTVQSLVTVATLVANRYSCPTPAKNQNIHIDNAGPVAEGMMDQQTIFIYRIRSVVSINGNIVGYNEYLLVMTVVVVFIS